MWYNSGPKKSAVGKFRAQASTQLRIAHNIVSGNWQKPHALTSDLCIFTLTFH